MQLMDDVEEKTGSTCSQVRRVCQAWEQLRRSTVNIGVGVDDDMMKMMKMMKMMMTIMMMAMIMIMMMVMMINDFL